MIYEQDCLNKCKISTICNCFICVYLSGENKVCSSAKPGGGGGGGKGYALDNHLYCIDLCCYGANEDSC